MTVNRHPEFISGSYKPTVQSFIDSRIPPVLATLATAVIDSYAFGLAQRKPLGFTPAHALGTDYVLCAKLLACRYRTSHTKALSWIIAGSQPSTGLLAMGVRFAPRPAKSARLRLLSLR